uniref:Xanthine dehydrogenase/oxidase-like n=1 Tax=Saccoglossus kowalevskii TaxID=10224 RepID=A0ABM0MKX1_SACKO|nr:PREDICTED: xanthine dehydrogenase/oxidase-like [Saccoglossus kowalevskii]
MNLLIYIRKTLGLRGSKLSCGEGGCGACTVMLSKYDHQQKKILHYAINACYTPVCSVHGMAITTVEGVGSRTKLHPVQERLAKYHGLQCGFCTPGMVMSMYSLLRNNQLPAVADIEDALTGNLCRCTGYRPILQAFGTFAQKGCCGSQSECRCDAKCSESYISSLVTGEFAPYNGTQEPIFPSELQLNDHYHSKTVSFAGKSVVWIRPTTLSELLKYKSDIPDAILVLGNAEVGFMPKPIGVKCTLLSVSHVQELKQVDLSESSITFGASVTMSRMIEVLRERIAKSPGSTTVVYKALLDMLYMVGDHQLRNVAGIGSHIMTASRLSDLNPLLMVAGVTLNIASHKDGLNTLPLNSDFYTGYRSTVLSSDQVLVSLSIPCSKENEYCAGYKVKKYVHRRDKNTDIISSGMRVLFERNTDKVKEISICFSGMGPTIVMATSVSKHIVGRKWNESLLTEVMHLLSEQFPLASQRMADYRKALLQSFFLKFYIKVNEHCGVMNIVQLPDSHRSAVTTTDKIALRSTQTYQPVPDHQRNSDLVGRPTMNESSSALVTGEAVFLDDMPCQEGELFFSMVTSTRAHARIISVDTHGATSLDGVRCYVGAADVPGNNDWGLSGERLDEQVFASEQVVCYGQCIGGIVADNPKLSSQAAKLVKVQYEDLPHILTIQDAINADSYQPHNTHLTVGDVTSAFDQSDYVIEGEIFLGGQNHYYMEPQCCIVRPGENGEITVFTSCQNLLVVQTRIADTLGIPISKVTCRTRRLGGAFGGKQTFAASLAMKCAVVAQKIAKPVRSTLTRDADMQFVGARHPVLAKYKVGCSKHGILNVVQIKIFLNGGCSLDLSVWVMHELISNLHNAYKIPVYDIEGRICKTNLPSHTAIRGFGSPQSIGIMEAIVDHVANKCGLPPEKVRESNMYDGFSDSLFQDMPDARNMRRCWADCLKKSDYYNRQKDVDNFNSLNRWKKRGIAMIPVKRVMGCFPPHVGGALVHIYLDGSVLLSHGGIEMGQGLYTKTKQIASRVLGISSEYIHIVETSTDKVPNAVPTAASSGTDFFGNAVKNACEILMGRLNPFIKDNPSGTWKEWVNIAYQNRVSLSATGHFNFEGNFGLDCDDPSSSKTAYYFSYSAGCCEVEIDCLTGDHYIRQMDIVLDSGNSLNPALDIGQIEGGFTMGYGYYCIEELRYSAEGELLTRGPGMYKIPWISDTPRRFNVSLLPDAPNKVGIFSAKAAQQTEKGRAPNSERCLPEVRASRKTVFRIKYLSGADSSGSKGGLLRADNTTDWEVP